MSLGMTLNSDRVAGVKKRMLRFMIEKHRRDIGAVEDVLQDRWRSVRCRSSVSCSWLLSAVSSSLSDCNSSFEVSSSSLVDWYSSLTDKASSLIALCSSPEISRLRMAPCSSVRVASSSCSSSATCERRRRQAGVGLLRPQRLPSTKQISVSSSPSTGTVWRPMSNETATPS